MIKTEKSCGNVFQDLGLPNADRLLEEAKFRFERDLPWLEDLEDKQ